MATDGDKPDSEELYELATNASTLKHDAVRRTSADVLRDMAMSADRIGGALLRLKSQWATASKPERMPVRSVKDFLAICRNKEDAIEAQRAEAMQADESYRSALAALAERLADLPLVREELMPFALRCGMGAPGPEELSVRKERQRADDERTQLLEAEIAAQETEDDRKLAQATLNLHIVQMRRRRSRELQEDRARARPKVGAVIRYWIQERCPRCDGLKFLVAEGTARLSKTMCPPPTQGGCGGTGYLEAPHGQMGRKLANHMDSLAHRYRRSGKDRRQQIAQLPKIEDRQLHASSEID
jgi:hypothetical protein